MTEVDIYIVIKQIAVYSVLLPALIGFAKIKTLNLTLRVLVVYLICCFITDQVYSGFLSDERKGNLLLNFWTLLECFFFCLIFYLEVKTRAQKKLIAFIYLAFVILGISIYYPNFSVSDNIVSTIEGGVMIIISISFFIKLLFDNSLLRPVNNYFFWINSGILLYFSATFLIFMTGSYLNQLATTNPMRLEAIWSIHNIVGIICNVFMSVGILQTNQKLSLT